MNFNSHAHVERDEKFPTINTIFDISTHTLTWSVTQGMKKLYMSFQDFNSHAHVERDRYFKYVYVWM